MTDEHQEQSPNLAAIPQPVLRKSKRLGVIWIIPVIAALVGIWLAVRAVTLAGPTITIAFKSAEGLVAGKTKIKFKDVEVGQVESLGLSPDLSHVTVRASMVGDIEPYLTTNTQFWVVRARVAAGAVSGLSTLFSGAYIGMDPGQAGEPARSFTGLESPPAATVDTPGRFFNLRAESLGSLDVGSPVYYRKIKVGQVVRYEMTKDGSAVNIRLFIQAPHDKGVHVNTRFWEASGFDATIDTSGVRINTDSLINLLIGGIAFQTPTNLQPGPTAPEDHTFVLYSSREQIDEPVYMQKLYLISYFDDNVRGLSKGAAVEFRGIKIGEVVDVKLEFSEKQSAFRTPVLMVIEPERIDIAGENKVDKEGLILKLIERGLRAQARTALLLTGQLYVHLSMYPEAAPQKLRHAGPYAVIPSVPGTTEEITSGITTFLKRLEKLPLEQIGSDLSASLGHIRQLVASEDWVAALGSLRHSLNQLESFTAALNSEVAPEFKTALAQLQRTLAQSEHTLSAAEGLVGGNAPLGYDVQQMLRELTKAGRAVTALADYLQRNPDAFIFGKGAPQP
ncbi:MAG: MCE family protein [Desulfobacteraceae bacterium]|nr:MAG: MCE family protein [Desulfobacteraceae bacterium]